MILALDIGTSSTRAVLYDTDTGDDVPGASHALAHEPDATVDGGSTLDADALVAEAVTCAQAVLSHPAAATSGRIDAVAVCTFWHSVVGVGADGRARTPVLLWSDRRSAPQVARLREELDPAAYTQRTGCLLHTSYPPGRLRWLAENEPVTFHGCARFVSPGEYLFSRFFGLENVTCSVSMASASGLMDQARGAWDAVTLAQAPGLAPDRLSPIGDAPVTGLQSPFREALPALASVPWFPALGDGACSNLGCGATTPNRLALMVGTSGALRVVTGRTMPVAPPGLWRYQADAERFLLGGALSNGGSVWAWLTDTLKMPAVPAAAVDAALAALPPDGHGLTVLPFLNGERAPGWRDEARAAIIGLSTATTPLEIARAHLEAVAFRFAAIRERLRTAAAAAEIIGTGAALTASPAWTQIIADVLGEPVRVSGEKQASSRGAALLARERLGFGAIETAPFSEDARFDPVPARAARYAEARARHQEMYRLLGGTEA